MSRLRRIRVAAFTQEMTNNPVPRFAPPHTEKRRGIRLLILSTALAVTMSAVSWLGATTNSDRSHDAALLPLFTPVGHGAGPRTAARSGSWPQAGSCPRDVPGPNRARWVGPEVDLG